MADLKNTGGEKISMDAANLYREENYTDLKSGTIVRLAPVRADGSDDPARKPRFIVRTQIYTDMGTLPIEAPVEATTIGEAAAAFPAAVEHAIEEIAQRIEQRQREASRQIVTPGQLMGGGRSAPGPGNLII